MSGASSRRKGHGYEVKCANELSERFGLDVRTTRALGASYGADLATVLGYDALGRPVAHIPTVLGWSIECKAWANRSPGAWLTQAENQSMVGAIPVVLWKVKYKAWDQGLAFTRGEDGTVEETTIEEWLAELPSKSERGRGGVSSET